MKKILIVLACLMSFNSMASYHYDWKSGNSYNTIPKIGGGASVYGYNYNTGSHWNTDIKSNGDMSGYDSNNNYWTYNKRSGSYYNYGTGKSCYGHGYSRHCY